jgi:hypothetical protein
LTDVDYEAWSRFVTTDRHVLVHVFGSALFLPAASTSASHRASPAALQSRRHDLAVIHAAGSTRPCLVGEAAARDR